MSKTKGAGSTKNGRDSQSKRLGVKAYDGTAVSAGVDHRPPAGHPLPPGRERRAAATTTPCSPSPTARSSSASARAASSSTSCPATERTTLADAPACGGGIVAPGRGRRAAGALVSRAGGPGPGRGAAP